ncbi:MAG: helix-turn-helix domain-containing protein [Lachnospiraceae bacterium]|nr:MAG: helix-turn-helix domain-containing protein [Lachnospiraceae bacterium]
MIRNGQLPAFKIGRNYRIPINALVEINTKPRMY